MTKGQKIKHSREVLGLSQSEVAEKLGEKKQTIYKYENDIVTNIPSDKLEKLAKILNITPAYLMGWDDDITQAEFDTLYRKYGKGSRLAFYLDALAHLPESAQEEVFSYIDYQATKHPNEKNA